MKQHNFFKNILKIKELETEPEIIKLFQNHEIESILNFYNQLPLAIYNEKQKIKKKHWILNVSKEIDQFIKKKLIKCCQIGKLIICIVINQHLEYFMKVFFL